MPLWAESRIHGDVYVRFGGRLSETYHRKVAWRRQPSLQITASKMKNDMSRLEEHLSDTFTLQQEAQPPKPYKSYYVKKGA